MSTSNEVAPTSIRVSLNLPFSIDTAADYLFEKDMVQRWIGSNAILQSEAEFLSSKNKKAELDKSKIDQVRPSCGEIGSQLLSDKDPATKNNTKSNSVCMVLELEPDVHAKIRLSPRPDGTCRLRIEHSGLEDEDLRRLSVKYWQKKLNRLASDMKDIQHNRRRERQAVIVVHGIGEQRPGQMLREFVANVFDRDAGELHFVKPDHISSLFEMRMATVPRNDADRPTTDVYELYWAHLVRDTTVAQVYGWILRLVFSEKSRIPESLTSLVFVFRSVFCVVLLTAIWLIGSDTPVWFKSFGTGVLAAIPLIAKFSLAIFHSEFLVGYAGDAARYLEPRADNIVLRQDIREAGAKLLDALHEKDRYARIIVYGHSLGSVIAYDIISHAWELSCRRRNAVQKTSSCAMRSLEDLLNPRSGNADLADIKKIQDMQHTAWQEYRRNGFQWRVSDFVTTGSPLAHAPWLLNLDKTTQFSDLVRERSFPTCPPQTESVSSPVPGLRREAFTFTHAYQDSENRKAKKSVQVPHHGGVFAVTRWTNLYFPYVNFFIGDPVAGPLNKNFGIWVNDIKLSGAKGFSHNLYTDRYLAPEAVAQVRAALKLPLHRPLGDYSQVAQK